MRIFLLMIIVMMTGCRAPEQETLPKDPNPHEVDVIRFNEIVIFASNRLPKRVGFWALPPTVYICPSSPANQARVERSIRFWETKLKYLFLGPITDPMPEACINSEVYEHGAILITLRGQDFPEDKLAVTRTYRRSNGEIVGARIELQGFAGRTERVLEHEFGHALGWQHTNTMYHLMHPVHARGGWTIRGLDASDEEQRQFLPR